MDLELFWMNLILIVREAMDNIVARRKEGSFKFKGSRGGLPITRQAITGDFHLSKRTE